MKNLIVLFFSIFISSCGVLTTASPKEGKTAYSYADVTGQYQLQREQKSINKKIVTRSVLVAPGGVGKIVEKTVTVSQL